MFAWVSARLVSILPCFQVGLIADINDVKAVLALGANRESWASVATNVARLQAGSSLGKALFAFAGYQHMGNEVGLDFIIFGLVQSIRLQTLAAELCNRFGCVSPQVTW